VGSPKKHIPVKLIVGLLSCDPSYFIRAAQALEKQYGTVDVESALLDFSCTDYYEREFGRGLKRKFLTFKRLVPPEKNHAIKLHTNRIEARLSRDHKRVVNIDPGYLTLANLTLLTTKDRGHRVYLRDGIYAEIELSYEHNSYRPLAWTYPDYRTEAYISFFNAVRSGYLVEAGRYRKP
jgi:hypothetical protein